LRIIHQHLHSGICKEFPSDAPGREETGFDHPTPLDEEGTLARTLTSFRAFGTECNVLVVAAGAAAAARCAAAHAPKHGNNMAMAQASIAMLLPCSGACVATLAGAPANMATHAWKCGKHVAILTGEY
jgi:hypothetical protein